MPYMLAAALQTKQLKAPLECFAQFDPIVGMHMQYIYKTIKSIKNVTRCKDSGTAKTRETRLG